MAASGWQYPRWFAVLLVAGCAVEPVTFSARALEDCATAGDEDDNGAADCDDEACREVDQCRAVCGDRMVGGSELCDEGGNTMSCDADCTAPACRDGVFNPAAEACDEGGNTMSCDGDCSPVRCGDSYVNPVVGEECDQEGVNTASCDRDCTKPKCNDGVLNALAGEEREPPSSPSGRVPVSAQTCRYDFSAITQLYCAGTCGAWGGGNGCQQEDADAFCKLKTGNPASTATSYSLAAAAPAPGVCCPGITLPSCIALGTFPGRGVAVAVAVDDTNLQLSHGAGQVVTNVVCTN